MKKKSIIVIGVILGLLLLAAGVAGFFYLKHHRQRQLPLPVFKYKIDYYDTSDKRYILLSPYRINRWWHGRLVFMDFKGNIIYQRYVNGSAYCFRQWTINGKRRYTWLVNDQQMFHMRNIKLSAGNFVLADSALNPVKLLTYIPNDSIKTYGKQGLDPHDLVLLSEDHYISMALYLRVATNIPDSLHPAHGKKICVPLIQEVNNGKLIWQWDAASFPELYGTSVEHNNFSDSAHISDYLHLNSFVLDPADSNLVCSFRNSNQVLKISRKTGQILWRLGGKTSDFPLTAEQHFLKQHDAQVLPDGSFMILDNGDSILRPHSRILEFKLDEEHRKVTGFKSFDIPAPFMQNMGNVTKEGDYYIIGGGTGGFVLKINAKTGEKKFELFSNLASYRAYIVNDISGVEHATGN